MKKKLARLFPMMLNYDANSVKKNFKTRLGINQLLLVRNKKWNTYGWFYILQN